MVWRRQERSRQELSKQARSCDYRLWIDLEQAPHPENRIVLSAEHDRCGIPRAILRWRWRAEDQENLQRVRVVVKRELERGGVGRVWRLNDDPPDSNVHHHAGTTRMDPDPRRGIVDANLRVHGVENLFVVGSSVFPTVGFANPTLTVVALALRLADHLASQAPSGGD